MPHATTVVSSDTTNPSVGLANSKEWGVGKIHNIVLSKEQQLLIFFWKCRVAETSELYTCCKLMPLEIQNGQHSINGIGSV